MNIFGRVFGGLLVLISLGWLATIVGIRPGWFGSNQINSTQGTATNSLSSQAKPSVGTTVTGAKNQASSFNAASNATAGKSTTTGTTTSTTTTSTEVEKNPRAATQPDKAASQTVPAAPAPAAAPPAPSAPVSAGW